MVLSITKIAACLMKKLKTATRKIVKSENKINFPADKFLINLGMNPFCTVTSLAMKNIKSSKKSIILSPLKFEYLAVFHKN